MKNVPNLRKKVTITRYIYSAFFLTVAIGNCMVKLLPPVNFCSDENIQTIFGTKLEDFDVYCHSATVLPYNSPNFHSLLWSKTKVNALYAVVESQRIANMNIIDEKIYLEMK
jgi:hypothetical protein